MVCFSSLVLFTFLHSLYSLQPLKNYTLGIMFNPKETHFEAASALNMFSDGKLKPKVSYPAYIGLDVHKETIAVAVGACGP